MTSTAKSPEEYIASLPEDRKQPIVELRKQIVENLPEGFVETMSYGQIGYVIPHSLHPAGYHCNPKLPVPFINLGSQKNFIVIHHLGIYGDEKLLEYFVNEYPKHSKAKLDMGKGCIRFKKMDQIPYQLIGELASKITPKEWLEKYETYFKK